ncbi:hypothetical protein N0B44_18445 [Roseibacterium beibuensis]|uniref:hypothetical protein n=1 Tax=[Roseibacterium] beibuensis TaxID=1193142 RepID=UPI00217E9293|nr:hypothetical protein [Roseibacterium beibuensis]MCS6624899.1 hypothetical protein [Roseibacterium beibuensis]
MSTLALIAALASLALQDAPQAPAAATAADGVSPAAEAPAETPEEEARLDERVCRTEAVVGTRFNSRTCMTRREWNRRRDDSRRLAHRLDSQNSNRDRMTAPGH